MINPAASWAERWLLAGHKVRRYMAHSGLAFLVFRYRYLASFTAIGLASILLELWVLRYLLPPAWPRTAACGAAFLVGMLFSFGMNALFNFRVAGSYLLRSFGYFAAISGLSFTLNMAVISALGHFDSENFAWLRLGSAGVLFMIGYTLHRRFTFEEARSFGLAVYATSSENVPALYRRLGRNCDHVHIDLIDNTMSASAAPIRLENIETVRKLWPGTPVAMHIMSTTPRQWVEQTWGLVDWYLVHVESEDDLFDLIYTCRDRRKKVGVVWRYGIAPASLLPYLPHVDFVMVLGIREPGRSGQELCPEALRVAHTLHRLRRRYGYEMMFDGGVKTTNVAEIPAKYIVAASAVTRAERPIDAAHVLRSPPRYTTPRRNRAA